MVKKKSLTENFIYSILYQLLVTVLPILTTPFTTRVLGLPANGIHAFTESIVTYFIVIGFFGTALHGTRKVAYVSKDHDELVQTTWDIIWLRLILMLVTLAVYIPLLCFHNQYDYIYRIQVINIIANGLDLSWFFQGIEDFKRVTMRNMLVKLLYVICLFVFIRSPADLPIYVLLIVGSSLVGNITMWFFLKDYLGKHSIRPPTAMKIHLMGSIMLFVPQMTSYIYSLLDRSMLGWMTNTDYVTVYDQSQRLIRAIIAIMQSVGYVMMAHLASLKASDEHEQIKRYIYQSLSLTLFFAFPMMFGLIGVAQDFIPLFLSRAYNSAVPAVRLLSPLVVITSVNSVLGVQLLISIGREKEYTIATTTGAVVSVVLNLFLLPKMNVIGACISSLVAETSVFLISFLSARDYLSIRKILKDNWLPFITAASMTFLIYLVHSLNLNVILRLFLEVVAAVLYYFVVMKASKNEILQLVYSKSLGRFSKKDQ